MAQMQFMDNTPQFRQQQEYNFLQSLLMWLFNNYSGKTGCEKTIQSQTDSLLSVSATCKSNIVHESIR